MENDPRIENLIKTVKEKGVEWAVAALVDGSIGYYSPGNALRIIKDLVEEKKLYGGAERTMACFKDDPAAELERDFKCFTDKEKWNKKGVENIIATVKAAANLSDVEAWTFSCMYPTTTL